MASNSGTRVMVIIEMCSKQDQREIVVSSAATMSCLGPLQALSQICSTREYLPQIPNLRIPLATKAKYTLAYFLDIFEYMYTS